MHYEELKENLIPPLDGVVEYLTGSPIQKDVLECLRENSEGKYHRTVVDKENPFPINWRNKLRQLEKEVYAMLDTCFRRGNCIDYMTLSGSFTNI